MALSRDAWWRMTAAFAVALLLALGGCGASGPNLQRSADGLVLGQTTIAQVVAKYGQPSARTTTTSGSAGSGAQAGPVALPTGLQHAPVPGSIEVLRFSQSQVSTPGLLVGVVDSQARSLTLWFWNDRLIYYSFSSSFAADTTNFDENRVSSFVRGQTTRADIIRDLGPPGGEGIYPYVAVQGTSMISYQYSQIASSGTVLLGSGITATGKLARFLFDASGRLLDTYISTMNASSRSRT
jgi:hypothetical protein